MGGFHPPCLQPANALSTATHPTGLFLPVTPTLLSLQTQSANNAPLDTPARRLHGCHQRFIEASGTAPLTPFRFLPIMRMALILLCPLCRVRPDLPFNRRPDRGSEYPHNERPQTRNQTGSARFQVFPPTATVDHHAGAFPPGTRGCGGLFGLAHDLLFWTQSNRPSWMRQERSRPAAAARILSLRFMASSPQASCGPSPLKNPLGTWEFTAPHVPPGSMSRFTRDQIQSRSRDPDCS